MTSNTSGGKAIASSLPGEICLHRFRVSEHLGVRGPYIVDGGNKQGEVWKGGGLLVHVSVVGRGGERNLRGREVRGLEKLERWVRGRDEVWDGREGVEWLGRWRNEWKVLEAGLLSGRGWEVLKGFGGRLREVYGEGVGKRGVVVVSGGGKWVGDSGKALGEGWGKGVRRRVLKKGDDDVVMFVRNCRNFGRFVGKGNGKGVEGIEKELEKEGKVTAGILGVDENELDEGILRSIYDVCSLQVAQKLRDDQFCKLLSPKYLLLREKLDEVKSPLLKAQEQFPSLSAPLARDVISSMDACISNSSSCAPVVVRLGDVETLVPFLSLLNVYKTEKKVRMTQLNTMVRMNTFERVGQIEGTSTCRSRLSTMAPFGGNLVMELYTSTEKSPDEPVVRFRLHEQYIERIVACGGKSFCTLSQLKNYLEPVLTSDWAHECAGHNLGHR